MQMPATINYRSASRALRACKDPQKAAFFRGYFKDTTGDLFLGISVPTIRRIAKKLWNMPLPDIKRLMRSKIHEERSLANEILRLKFQKGPSGLQKQIFDFYVRNRRLIYGWDAVDGSAPYIIGCYLLNREKKLLYQLAVAPRIWDRRIAIVSTLWFIRCGETRDALKLAEILLCDHEDLIHKATGWILREVGKQDLEALKSFLATHSTVMPRTMLRYAIERFAEAERKKYLSKKRELGPR